jgi:hypothetical protein
MSKSRIKQSAFTLLFATAVSLSLSVGCSKQGEGERCDHEKAGDSDCDDGLVCAHIDNQDRCCPPAGAPIGDSRCQRTGVSTGGQGNSGGSNTGGKASGGNGGNASGGAPEGGAPVSSGGSPEAGAPAQSGGQSSGGDGA